MDATIEPRGPRHKVKWTAEMDQALRDGVSSGKTYKEVARLLGIVTRNAAIGRGKRIGLAAEMGPRSQRWTADRTGMLRELMAQGHSYAEIASVLGGGFTARAVDSKVERLGLRRGKRPPRRSRITLPPLRVKIDDLAIPIEQRRTIFELTNSTCRYPIGGEGISTVFCGGQVKDGSSYCCAHHSRCWRYAPSPRKVRRSFVERRR